MNVFDLLMYVNWQRMFKGKNAKADTDKVYRILLALSMEIGHRPLTELESWISHADIPFYLKHILTYVLQLEYESAQLRQVQAQLAQTETE